MIRINIGAPGSSVGGSVGAGSAEDAGSIVSLLLDGVAGTSTNGSAEDAGSIASLLLGGVVVTSIIDSLIYPTRWLILIFKNKNDKFMEDQLGKTRSARYNSFPHGSIGHHQTLPCLMETLMAVTTQNYQIAFIIFMHMSNHAIGIGCMLLL
jgi:hypothetical protein